LTQLLLFLAVALQGVAVAYGLHLLYRRRGAAGAWLFLLGAMLSMLVWRVVVFIGVQPPAFFNPAIAIWGSACIVLAMFLFGREVARREEAEAERDRLLSSERAARTEAERASRLKDDFLATLSHELRTPLSAILGWCAVLRHRREDPTEFDKALDTIERNARVQGRLIDDLLDVTRMQAGSLHLELAPIAMDAPVRAAIEASQPAAAAKDITIDFACDDMPPVVVADASRLQQVVSNLLVNAVKFTPSGGKISVSIGAASNQARLVVEDNGEGIDAAFVPHLFTRFRQADSSTTRRHGGLGLGLSIVASLVRLHEGEVNAYSDGLRKGARFIVTLPLAPTGAREQGRSGNEDSRTGTEALPSLKEVRVIVIDDQSDVRLATAQLLEKVGAQVLPLASGAEIERALASFRPHVLLIDIGMPEEDGYSLIQRIRKLPAPAGGDVPAISFTAHAREEDRTRALASGFQSHLPKPVDLPVLVDAVRALAASRVAPLD